MGGVRFFISNVIVYDAISNRIISPEQSIDAGRSLLSIFVEKWEPLLGAMEFP